VLVPRRLQQFSLQLPAACGEVVQCPALSMSRSPSMRHRDWSGVVALSLGAATASSQPSAAVTGAAPTAFKPFAAGTQRVDRATWKRKLEGATPAALRSG